MKGKKYRKKAEKKLTAIADSLLNMTFAESLLEYDTATMKLMDQLNDLAEFVEKHNDNIPKERYTE